MNHLKYNLKNHINNFYRWLTIRIELYLKLSKNKIYTCHDLSNYFDNSLWRRGRKGHSACFNLSVWKGTTNEETQVKTTTATGTT